MIKKNMVLQRYNVIKRIEKITLSNFLSTILFLLAFVLKDFFLNNM